MPLYEYRCDDCGVFAALGRMSASAAPAVCPECGSDSERILSAPHLAILGKAQRTAHERNEKSAHDPQMRRKSSCGCAGTHTCKPGNAAAKKPAGDDGKPALQMQTKKTARPWMLSH